jgi:hypothetical protein
LYHRFLPADRMRLAFTPPTLKLHAMWFFANSMRRVLPLFWAIALLTGARAEEEPLEEYQSLNGVCFGAPGFVAVGDPGLIEFSPDGDTWIEVSREKTSEQVNSFYAATYARGKYFVVGASGSMGWFTSDLKGTLATSSDGLHWSTQILDEDHAFYDVVAGDPGILILGDQIAWFSTDGENWRAIPFPEESPYGAAYGNGLFVVASVYPLGGDFLYSREIRIWTSADGQNWKTFTPLLPEGYGSLFFEGSEFYLGPYASKDGFLWREKLPKMENPGPAFLSSVRTSVRYFDGLFVSDDFFLPGTSFSSKPKTSTDGQHWLQSDLNGYFYQIVRGRNKWFALTSADILASREGVRWISKHHLDSERLLLTNNAPSIRVDLKDKKTLREHSTAFQISVAGQEPLSFQWFHNNQKLANATNSYYLIGQVSSSDAGEYDVEISNSAGTIKSSTARLTLRSPAGPQILQQPADVSAQFGENITLSIQVSGTEPLTYRWFHKGLQISNQNSPVLLLPGITERDLGAYQVEIENEVSRIRTELAQVTLAARPFQVWEPIDPALGLPDWHGIAFGNGIFVTVGGQGDVAVSSDGHYWTFGKLPTTDLPTGICFDGERFLTCTSGGEICVSANGVDWLLQAEAPFPLLTISAGNETTVASGSDGNLLLFKPNAPSATAKFGGSEQINQIVWASNHFIAFCDQSIIGVSTNGIDWFREQIGSNVVWRAGYGTATNALALGTSSSPGQIVARSATFKAGKWTSSAAPLVGDPFFGGFETLNLWAKAVLPPDNNRKFPVAVGWEDGIASLINGRWQITFIPVGGLRAITSGNDMIVAVGDHGAILTSTNAVNWGLEQSFPGNILGLAYDGTRFVALADRAVLVSTNGVNWTAHESDLTPTFVDSFVAHDGVYLVRSSGSLYWSSNLYKWTRSLVPTPNVAWGNDLFLGASPDARIWASTNGIKWGPIATLGKASRATFQAFFPGDGNFWVAGSDGRLFKSRDAAVWETFRPNPAIVLSSLVFDHGRYLASASIGADDQARNALYSSKDALHWELISRPPRAGFTPQLYVVDGLFYGVDYTGIYISADGEHWKISLESGFGTSLAFGPSDIVVSFRNATFLHTRRLPAPDLVALDLDSAGGSLTLRGSGRAGTVIQLESSPNQKGPWDAIKTLTLDNGQLTYPIGAPSTAQQFYRAVIP